MKKALKRLSVLLLLGAMVFALCGCRELDEMRAQQVFTREDGTIYIGDTHYLPLEASNYFDPSLGGFYHAYNLTNPDVPVLLSTQFRVGYLELTEDGRFVNDLHNNTWYCREDLFEEMQARNREPFIPDVLFYNYCGYDKNGEWKEMVYTLTLEEAAAIAEVVKGEPLKLGDGVYLGTDWAVGLTEASEDLVFRYSGPSLCKAGNSLYINTYGEDGATTYQVPEKYNDLLENMAKYYLAEFYPEYAQYAGYPTEPHLEEKIDF